MTNKEFVEENYRLINHISLIIGKVLSNTDREDLVQDTILKILESDSPDIRQPSAFINVVMNRILMNKSRDGMTDCMGHAESLDQPKYKEEEGLYTLYDVIPGSRVTDGEELGQEVNPYTLDKDDIDNLCVYLTDDRAKLFKMRYYLGMTPQEIADDLGMNNKAVKMTLLRAVGDARRLTQTVPSSGVRYDGLSLQEMCLAILPDEVLFPFKLYYTNSKSIMDIIKLTGIGFDGVKRALSLGERMIHERYGLDVRQRSR